jgi:hypothetical protein
MTSYFDIYLNQLFTTLGQITAALVSSTVIVPVYTYYSKQVLRNSFSELIKEHLEHKAGVDLELKKHFE